MKPRATRLHHRIIFSLLLVAASRAYAQTDALPSWNDTPTKTAIADFVKNVTTTGSADFVKPEERIAVFDNDGTLWCEQPLYFQGLFALDRIKALAPQHPEWANQEPFKSVPAGDIKAVAATGEKGMLQIIATTHAGMTTDEFSAIVKEWLTTARHPIYHRPYTSLVYQPMLELLTFLRTNGFKTYIVSGGGVEFMRTFAEQTYGIPPEQVIGSSGKLSFEQRAGKWVLVKLPAINFIDDGPGKPEAIQTIIGRRPIMAFGNSDGDLPMLEWTTSAPGPHFALLVHHTDAAREFAYDRTSAIGKCDKALDEAAKEGWTITDMKLDWKTIFPPE